MQKIFQSGSDYKKNDYLCLLNRKDEHGVATPEKQENVPKNEKDKSL
jgi:hypothetical protein